MLLPRVSQNALAHVIAHELDDVLDAVDERALRHERGGLLLLEHENHDEHEGQGHSQPEGVVGQAKRRIADDGVGHEAIEQLVDLLGELV